MQVDKAASVLSPILLMFTFANSPIAAETQSVTLTKTTSLEFANSKKGSELLRQTDEFVMSLSPIDRQLRLQSMEDVSTADYLKFVGEQTLDWSQPELEKVSTIAQAIAQQLTDFNLPLPETIEMVKTNGKDEGAAPYCRGASTIVLPQRILNAPSERLQKTVTHELFHILSRQDKVLRDKMYATIGFQRVKFEYPKALRSRKITNPDAAILTHFIQLQINDNTNVSAVPVTFSKKERYDEGSLFDYLTFKLLIVEVKDGNAAAVDAGSPELLDPNKQVDYFRQIGRNTGYIIHPEEILADNFVHLLSNRVDLPNPEILESLRKLLKTDDKSE